MFCPMFRRLDVHVLLPCRRRPVTVKPAPLVDGALGRRTDRSTLTGPKQNSRDQNSGCRPGPYRVFPATFPPPAQRDARAARATLGRADGKASHPTVNRASGARPGADMVTRRDRQHVQATVRSRPGLQSLGPTAEAMVPGCWASSFGQSAWVDPIDDLTGPARDSMGSLRDRFGVWTRSTPRRSSCWTACRPPPVSGCRALRLVRTRLGRCRLLMPWRQRVAASGGHDADPRKSVGGHRPQFPMAESMRFRCHAFLSMLAMLADADAGAG